MKKLPLNYRGDDWEKKDKALLNSLIRWSIVHWSCDLTRLPAEISPSFMYMKRKNLVSWWFINICCKMFRIYKPGKKDLLPSGIYYYRALPNVISRGHSKHWENQRMLNTFLPYKVKLLYMHQKHAPIHRGWADLPQLTYFWEWLIDTESARLSIMVLCILAVCVVC